MSVEDGILHAFSSFSSSCRITSSFLSIFSSTKRTWARCHIIEGTGWGGSGWGGEHPGEESGWMLMFDMARAPTFGPGRTRMEPHAMRTWAGTRLNQVSKTPGMGVITSLGISSSKNPWYMLKRSWDSPGPRFTLLLWYHTCGSLVVGSTNTMIPRRTGTSRRRSWKATPASSLPS